MTCVALSAVVDKVCNLAYRRNPVADEQFLSELRLLAANGADVHAEHTNSFTALHYASFHCCAQTCAVLIELGANVNARTDSDWSPLHYCSLCNTNAACSVLRVLIDAGTDMNAKNGDGDTPLHMAVRQGCCDFIDVLLNAGADPDVLDDAGFTPLQRATCLGYELVVTVLLARGAYLRVPNSYNVYAYGTKAKGLGCLVWLLAAASLSAEEQNDFVNHLGVTVCLRSIDDPSAGYNLRGIEYLLAAGVDCNCTHILHANVEHGGEQFVELIDMFRASTNPMCDFCWYAAKRNEIAERRTRLIKMIFERMIPRALPICLALEHLPALITLAVIDFACDERQRVPMYKKWNLITTVKHFCFGRR